MSSDSFWPSAHGRARTSAHLDVGIREQPRVVRRDLVVHDDDEDSAHYKVAILREDASDRPKTTQSFQGSTSVNMNSVNSVKRSRCGLRKLHIINWVGGFDTSMAVNGSRSATPTAHQDSLHDVLAHIQELNARGDSKHQQIRVNHWVRKLQTQPTSNPTWMKNVLEYATTLLQMLMHRALDEPFVKMPPQGSLPTLLRHHVQTSESEDQWEWERVWKGAFEKMRVELHDQKHENHTLKVQLKVPDATTSHAPGTILLISFIPRMHDTLGTAGGAQRLREDAGKGSGGPRQAAEETRSRTRRHARAPRARGLGAQEQASSEEHWIEMASVTGDPRRPAEVHSFIREPVDISRDPPDYYSGLSMLLGFLSFTLKVPQRATVLVVCLEGAGVGVLHLLRRVVRQHAQPGLGRQAAVHVHHVRDHVARVGVHGRRENDRHGAALFGHGVAGCRQLKRSVHITTHKTKRMRIRYTTLTAFACYVQERWVNVPQLYQAVRILNFTVAAQRACFFSEIINQRVAPSMKERVLMVARSPREGSYRYLQEDNDDDTTLPELRKQRQGTSLTTENEAHDDASRLPSLQHDVQHSRPPVDEQQQRQMRSFLHNFLADDHGAIQRVLDLALHARDTRLVIADATLHEVVATIPQLRGLQLNGYTHITDAGLWTIARQCPQLGTIHLAQCARVTELGLRLLAHNCPLGLVELSECPQITDTVLQTLAAGCWTLHTLILRRCARISDAGIVKIAQCCKQNLRHVDVSECEHVGEYGDKALVEIGKWCPQLTHLDLFRCRHVHDAGVRAIARGYPLLTTLKLTGCRDVSSIAIQALASQCLALHTLSLAGCVQMTNADVIALATKCKALTWLDISGSPNIDAVGVRAALPAAQVPEPFGLPTHQRHGTRGAFRQQRHREERVFVVAVTAIGDARARKLQRDRRILEWKSAVKIQAAMRGCLTRGGLWETKLKYVQRHVPPKIQARVRGFLVRKRIAADKQHTREDAAASRIGREYRNVRLRRMLARTKRLCRIQENENEAALVFQRLFRGYQSRTRVRNMKAAIRQQQLAEAHVQVMLELAAVKAQRSYRGHRGRCDAAMLHAAREASRRQAQRELEAVLFVQRVYRGHQGRQQRAQRLTELLHRKKQHDGAVMMQKVVRGHRGRRNALILRKEAEVLVRINAAMTIQWYWRGLRQKHLSAVLLGLIKLRAREHEAANAIQRAYRMHMSRGFVRTMRLTLIAQRKRVASAITIQRVLRGHRGRAEAEVQRELRKLEAQVKPSFAKQARLHALIEDQRERVTVATSKLRDDELEKTMQTKTKYHDSSRTTGTPQRFLTQYLQVQLAEQLRALRIAIALDTQSLEQIMTQLQDAEKQHRLVLRQLEPLTHGVIANTKANRTARLQQRRFRGFRVRCAVREGGNCWIELWTSDDDANGGGGAQPAKYYYNTLASEARWQRPLATDIFHDTFAESVMPAAAAVVTTSTAGRQQVSTSGQLSSTMRGRGAWYEAFDDRLQATCYFHSGTKECQWERPPEDDTLANAFANQSTRRQRQEWIDEYQDNLEELLATTTERPGAAIGPWQVCVDPISEHFVYFHPETQQVKASLSPRSVHMSIGNVRSSRTSRRSPPSIRTGGRDSNGSGCNASSAWSVQWQYRCGYEYDAVTGHLVASSRPRPVWNERLDQESSLTYYFNALTNEYRWERPQDVDATFDEYLKHPNASRAWFEATQQQQGDANSNRELTSRSQSSQRTTRVLDEKWVELMDPETQHTYYYNEITGETRWSLSPRSARSETDDEQHMSLALYAQVKRLREAPVAYESRDEHMKWLESAIAERNWKQADALVQQILIREQSQVMSAQKQSSGRSASEALQVGAFGSASAPLGKRRSNSEADMVMKTPASDWVSYVDENGAAYFYNQCAGETSWTAPVDAPTAAASVGEEASSSSSSAEWQRTFDADGNAYYYNAETGETSWTDPTTPFNVY
ncbi:hypothetical protein FI667_g202, partial [Globisporangium splendens]